MSFMLLEPFQMKCERCCVFLLHLRLCSLFTNGLFMLPHDAWEINYNYIPGPQTHHELRLKWLTQAQRTDSGGNWMAFIMSFRPQTLQKWAWMSWEIVLTKMGVFVPHLINFGSLDFRFQGSFLSAFILNSRKAWTFVFVGYIRTCLLFLLMCILSECTILCVLYASSDPFEIPEWYCQSAML
jgi:hypothetical protein